MTGSDKRVERIEVEASSSFDAAYQALERFAKLWWWNPDEPIVVHRGGYRFEVWSRQASEWKQKSL